MGQAYRTLCLKPKVKINPRATGVEELLSIISIIITIIVSLCSVLWERSGIVIPSVSLYP